MLTRYSVPPETRRSRADKALAAAFPEHSRTALQRAFDAGLVKRDGGALKRDSQVVGGDSLEFEMPDAVASELRPVAIPLDILFEDRHLLAVNKPPGMVVHPGAATGEDTLVHALLAHCRGGLSGVGGVERPGIVHRLDRGTSGVIIVAKSDAAHRGLASQFANRSLNKEYLALVAGEPSLLSGSVRAPIGRNPRQRHKMAVSDAAHGGRDAHTDWEVVERFSGIATLLRCAIHTGRTHQIRVHMQSAGSVILGDGIYGWKPNPLFKVQPGRVMLHAEHLVATHPVTGKVLNLRAPLPTDFETQLAQLRQLARAAAKARRLVASGSKSRKKSAASLFHVHESRR